MSPLTLTINIKIGLLLVFKIDIRPHATRIIHGYEDLADMVLSFIDTNTRIWGTWWYVAIKAGSALLELMESGFSFYIVNTSATIALTSDEYNFDIHVEFEGKAITIPQDMPSHEELLEDQDLFLQLSLALVRKHSDSLKVTRSGGIIKVNSIYEHTKMLSVIYTTEDS
jgi:hypothetical protein